MKIIQNKKGDFGNFKIAESTGRKITQKFVDFETKLIIVIEKFRDINSYGGYKYKYITINPENGNEIEIEERIKFINYNAQYGKDEESQLTWTITRIHKTNGNESIKIEMHHPNIEASVKSGIYYAFSEKPHKPIPILYKQTIKERNKEKVRKEDFLKEYNKKSHDEKITYWSGNLHQRMRWNGESGFNEYAVFNKEWLAKTKKYEPNIENIIEDILENIWKGYWDLCEIRARLNK